MHDSIDSGGVSGSGGTTASPGLAFSHLNLRRNPFGEPRREQRGWLAVADERIEQWATRLARPGFALQILGDSGRGKTTHLLALHTRFPRAPFVYVGVGEYPRLPRGTPFFLDEAQRVGRRRRARLFRRPVSLVLGTHRDLTSELRDAGLEVATFVPQDELSPEKLARIFKRRIHWARRSDGPTPTISERTVRALHDQYGTDVRAMERVLYRAFQRARGVGHVEL